MSAQHRQQAIPSCKAKWHRRPGVIWLSAKRQCSNKSSNIPYLCWVVLRSCGRLSPLCFALSCRLDCFSLATAACCSSPVATSAARLSLLRRLCPMTCPLLQVATGLTPATRIDVCACICSIDMLAHWCWRAVRSTPTILEVNCKAIGVKPAGRLSRQSLSKWVLAWHTHQWP